MTMIRRLAEKEHSAALDRLTSSISAIMKLGARTDESQFTKVKSLISDMSDRLQAEVPSEVRDTSYRDERTSKATKKKENLEADVTNMKFDAGAGEDPSMKVQGSITELINPLLEETSSDATQKACCDEETSRATEKENLDADTAKHSSTLVSRSSTLDGEISTLRSELSAVSNRQLQTDTTRRRVCSTERGHKSV